MRILFDQGVPAPLRRHLTGHDVETAAERDWSELSNGELLSAAEREGFELLITTDQNLRYQQNLSDRNVGILVLMTTSWPRIRESIDAVTNALANLNPGDYQEVAFRD